MTDAAPAQRLAGGDPHWIAESASQEPVIPASVVAKWHWYRTTSKNACRRSHGVEVLNLVLAALAPAVTVILDQPVIGAALGTAAVIVGGVRSTFRWHENWISRSRTRYAIEREIAYYKHHVTPYDTGNSLAILVKAIEEITEAEGRTWEAERRNLPTTPPPSTDV